MSTILNSPYYVLAKDLIYISIAAFSIVAAYKGLYVWKQQIKGKVEYDAARRLYRAVLKLRDAISYVRNPWIPIGEMQMAAKKYPEADPTKTSAVYYARWEKLTAAMSELQLELLEAEVLWGREAVTKVEPIKSCITKLNLAISQLLAPPEQRTSNRNFHDIIYEFRTEEKTDAFTNEIDSVVEDIGNFLRPKYDLGTQRDNYILNKIRAIYGRYKCKKHGAC